MASKGQKFNSYSKELKLEILNKYLNNQGSSGSLAKEYNISSKTIDTWIFQYKKGNDISTDKRGIANKKQSDIDYKERYEILKNFQDFIEARRGKK